MLKMHIVHFTSAKNAVNFHESYPGFRSTSDFFMLNNGDTMKLLMTSANKKNFENYGNQ